MGSEAAADAQTAPLVDLDGVWRTMEGDPPIHAVADVSLRIERGEWWSVTGASGSGKSTLLNLIGCLDRPTEGTYRFDGMDVAELDDARRAGLRAHRLGFVFQGFHLMSTRSATDNVAVADLYRRGDRRDRRERAREALRRVGLGDRLDADVTKLSGGERQRVAIARALLGRPDLLLCDEPTGNLDSGTTAEVLDLLDQLHADGQTLLVVTHEADVARRAGASAEMTDGALVVTRSPDAAEPIGAQAGAT
jgi:putative ABC transport system ATP-binding protein